MAIEIMAHLVAGFPARQGFIQALKGLKDGGADILELQIPFSDPTADGPVITEACEDAIREGFQVEQVFDYIRDAQDAGFERIIVMTYANIAFCYGIERYVHDLKTAGVEAALVPDLPIEDEEGFYARAFECGLTPMPVVVVNMPPERREILKSRPFDKIYVSIRAGITGRETLITPEIQSFLDSLKDYRRFAGFGIRSPEQVRALEPHADVAVVGSYFTSVIHEACSRRDDIYKHVKHAMQSLRT